MKTKIQDAYKNDLQLARKRARLERKQVAFLLNRKTTDEISLYEKGAYPPNLKTALKLEAIYQVPIKLLYRELFEQIFQEISQLKRQHASLFPDPNWFPTHAEQLKQEEFCFFAEILKTSIPNKLELNMLDKHVVSLMNTASFYRNGQNPYP